MTYETLALDVDARGVATLTLNRPDKHNAMSAGMISELSHAAGRLASDTAVRVVVLTGAGRSFCAGADLGWMQTQMAADAAARFKEAKALANMLNALNELPKPLIGKINGAAFGGGVGMACVCDIAIAAPDAKFGLTETRLGIIPATISPYVLARVGEAHARRVFMSGRRFDAQEAVELGFVAGVEIDLDGAVEAEIAPYLEAAPQAVARAKVLARKLGPPITEAIIDDTIQALVDAWESEEAQEGIGAFFEKRKPRWQT